jgi:hypothetical protein
MNVDRKKCYIERKARDKKEEKESARKNNEKFRVERTYFQTSNIRDKIVHK